MNILKPPPPPIRTPPPPVSHGLAIGDIVYVRAKITGMRGDWVSGIELTPVGQDGKPKVIGNYVYCHELEVLTAQELKDELRG